MAAKHLSAQKGFVPTIPLLHHNGCLKVKTTRYPPHLQIVTMNQSPIVNVKAIRAVQASHRPAATSAADVLTKDLDNVTSEASEGEKNQDASFSWSRAWYAVNVLGQLDGRRPHGFHLLGRPMVLWRDKEGEWRCFLDQCPHRLVPLSEVRHASMARVCEGGWCPSCAALFCHMAVVVPRAVPQGGA